MSLPNSLDEGTSAPPRSNGELVFTAPWQQRAFGVTMSMTENGSLSWEAFRERLIARIAESSARPYWESWLAALEDALAMSELLPGTLVEARHRMVLDRESHDHDHD